MAAADDGPGGTDGTPPGSGWYAASLDRGPDPYADWALGPGRAFLVEGEGNQLLFTALVQLGDGVDVDRLLDAFKESDAAFGKPDEPSILHIDAIYRDRDTVFRKAPPRTIVAKVASSFFARLAADEKLRRFAPRVLLGAPVPPGDVEPGVEPSPGKPRQCGAVVGVIDDGLALAHQRFRNADGSTRIEYAWVQDGQPVTAASPFLHGREYTKHQIDTLLAQSTRAGILDEDEFYRRAGLADFGREGHKGVALRAAHGTHVMDAAAGYDPADLPGNERPIVCVQLPAATTADTSGARLDPYVDMALHYILDRAARIGGGHPRRPPVVINFSYGTIAGPHDGTSILETAIDGVVQQYATGHAPVSIVLPSGNSHLSRCHAHIEFPKKAAEDMGKATAALEWRVLPDDHTSSFVEIWLPYAPPPIAASRVELQIIPPGANNPQSPWLGEVPGTGWEWQVGGDVVCKVTYVLDPPPVPTQRGCFTVAILPTAHLGPALTLAPSGVWTIRLVNRELAPHESVNAWIQRDDTPHGYRVRGRQSYFDNDCYERFDATSGRELEVDQAGCVIRRAGLINAIATGREPSVIGGFVVKEAVSAPYAAGGPITPTRDDPAPHRTGPDAVAASEDSRVHRGTLAAGTRSGSVVALNGTSVAAPPVTRFVADELAAGRPGDRAAVQARAAADDAAYPPLPANEARRGAGRLRLPPTVARARYWD